MNTVFKGNIAMMGGALRLAGKVSIDNCSFTDNVSELGGGPAVSNLGFISNVIASNFHDNVFNCMPQTFLDSVKVSNAFVNVYFAGPWPVCILYTGSSIIILRSSQPFHIFNKSNLNWR